MLLPENIFSFEFFFFRNISVLLVWVFRIPHTLTGHFIRYNSTGLDPLFLQNCLNSSWHRFNKVLETFLRDFGHIDMIASCSCCRFVGCISMMWISRSTTSQRCSIGLRSGDCGGHLSKVNSLSCSRNQSASGFNVLCVQRWYSAYLGSNEWLFELLFPFYQL